MMQEIGPEMARVMFELRAWLHIILFSLLGLAMERSLLGREAERHIQRLYHIGDGRGHG